MRLYILILLAAINCTHTTHSQGVIDMQAGTGVPTDMAVGGLLGALLAPMISKGSDAKLVGGLLGAVAGGAYGTVQQQQRQSSAAYQSALQQEHMRLYMQQQQQQMALMQQQMAVMQTSAGGSRYAGEVATGISKGVMTLSPYSKFSLNASSMGLARGSIVYDPFCGRPFRIP